jgi:MYXO-CTERM domain-containing protein
MHEKLRLKPMTLAVSLALVAGRDRDRRSLRREDRNVMFVAWGTETNVPNVDVSTPLDIYLTRTTDQGVNYEKVQLLAEGVAEQSEAQLRSPPDGKTLGALWMERDATSVTTDVVYRNGIEAVAPDVPVPPSGGGGGGCAVGGDGRFDPTLPAMLIVALTLFGWRRRAAG